MSQNITLIVYQKKCITFISVSAMGIFNERESDEEQNGSIDKFPSAPSTPGPEQLTVSTIISLSPDLNYEKPEKLPQENGKSI